MFPQNNSSYRYGLPLLTALMVCFNGVSVLAADSEPLAGLERIEVTPAKWKLTGRQSVQLVVTGIFSGDMRRDLTSVAKFEIDTAAVRLEAARVMPVKNGTTTVIALVGNKTARSQLVVQNLNEPPLFSRDVLPLLSRHGCSSGACHGSPSGKGGFRLSLRAFQPTLDAETLLREELGRRVNVMEPAKSLLLLKPTMRVAHGGGLQLRRTDTGYAVLRDWVGSGCRIDRTTSPCTKIEVWPNDLRTLSKPHDKQQIRVVGHFEDGARRDITDVAVFSTSDESVAQVSSSGLVQSQRRGEAAIVVRYLQHIQSVMVQSSEQRPNFVWVDRPQHNYIDRLVDAKLRRLKLAPQPVCSDEQFIRRVYLDVLGILPAGAEVTRFLNDPNPAKRARLIDRLLEHPQFASFWTLKWGDLLRMSRRQIGAKGLPQYYEWVRNAVRTNMPYDEFVKSLLTASGGTWTSPAANYFRTEASTDDVVETTAQTFLGMRIQCAKCHNHPFERWTQSDYYGMSAFFHRVKRKRVKGKGKGKGDVEVVVSVAKDGDVRHPQTGELVKPWAPEAGSFSLVGSTDIRHAFADWLVDKKNPFLARVEVNRIWTELMGRGIVHPFDDFRDSNPPANGQLLKQLADDFLRHGFDRQHIIRRILTSRTYQAASLQRAKSLDLHEARLSEKYFASYPARMLTAEQLLDAICYVTDVPEKLGGHPVGARATGMIAPDLANHDFLRTFGQPQRQAACQCERGKDTGLPRALALFNGPLVQAKLSNKANRFHRALSSGVEAKEIVGDLYLAALSRRPSQREQAIAERYIDAAKDKAQAIEDVCWAIMNKTEFLFQH